MKDHRITRESLLRDNVGEWRHKYAKWVTVLTPEQFQSMFAIAMKTAPPSDAVWVFAYGSLLWNPAIEIAEQRVGRLFGFHRSFCLQSLVGRGTPEYPGLMLALRGGGSCQGLAFRLPTNSFRQELELVFRREVMTGGYRAMWRNVYTQDGIVRAMCFVIDPRSPRYVGDLSDGEAARVIGQACGPLGPNCDYLHRTIASLLEHGIRDRYLERLADLI